MPRRHLAIFAILATLVPLAPQSAPAAMPTEAVASFDCRRATSRAEHLVCGDPLLSTYDRGVAAAYRAVRRDARTLGEQRAWLRERDLCHDIACVRRSYSERLESLFESVPQSMAVRRPDRSGWLTMLPLGSGDYAFHLDAFHQGLTPASVNVGDATGVVRTRGGAGTYRGDGCSIAFEAMPRGRGWLVETSDDVECGAGHNVRLGGRYSRPRA